MELIDKVLDRGLKNFGSTIYFGYMSRCVVCDKQTSGSLEFCRKHYQDHKEDIIEKKPWVKALKNDAQRERRRREREQEVSLDAMLDPQFDKPY